MELGAYLIQVRNERGYSQRDLAEKSGVSPAEISRVESGKHQTPSPGVLRALANALVVDYHYLMQLAGYIEGNPGAEPEPRRVFQDEETGRIIDSAAGADIMIAADPAWANAAFRVSTELSEEDRGIMTRMAMEFLKKYSREP